METVDIPTVTGFRHADVNWQYASLRLQHIVPIPCAGRLLSR